MNELISIGEACIRFDVSANSLRLWVAQKKITAYQTPGGHLRFDPELLRSQLTVVGKPEESKEAK